MSQIDAELAALILKCPPEQDEIRITSCGCIFKIKVTTFKKFLIEYLIKNDWIAEYSQSFLAKFSGMKNLRTLLDKDSVEIYVTNYSKDCNKQHKMRENLQLNSRRTLVICNGDECCYRFELMKLSSHLFNILVNIIDTHDLFD